MATFVLMPIRDIIVIESKDSYSNERNSYMLRMEIKVVMMIVIRRSNDNNTNYNRVVTGILTRLLLIQEAITILM